MTEILKVGKYSGKEFQWIMENDIEYCKNILQMRIVSSAILPFKKYLKKKKKFQYLILLKNFHLKMQEHLLIIIFVMNFLKYTIFHLMMEDVKK